MITDAHLAEANQLMIIAQAKIDARLAEARFHGGKIASELTTKIRTGVAQHRAPKAPRKIRRSVKITALITLALAALGIALDLGGMVSTYHGGGSWGISVGTEGTHAGVQFGSGAGIFACVDGKIITGSCD